MEQALRTSAVVCGTYRKPGSQFYQKLYVAAGSFLQFTEHYYLRGTFVSTIEERATWFSHYKDFIIHT